MKYLENKYIVFGIIAVLVAIIYGQTINHGFVMDDTIYVVKNEVVKEHLWANALLKSATYGFDKDNTGAYRPVYVLSLLLNDLILGHEAKGFHFIQIILYCLVCISVFQFMKEVLDFAPLLAFLVSLLFLVHPIHVEVVSNIKSRDEILGTIFLVWAIILFNRGLIKSNLTNYLGATVTFLCAILCKETFVPCVMVFPVLLMKNKCGWTRVKTLLWVVTPVFIVLVLRGLVLDAASIGSKYAIDPINNMLYTSEVPFERFLTSLYYQWFYFKQLFVPHPLLHEYSIGTISIQKPGDMGGYLGLLVLVVIVYFTVQFVKRKQYNLLMGVVIYIMSLILVSNLIIHIPANVSDRFLFVPSLGFVIVIGSLLMKKIQLQKMVLLISLGFVFMSFNRATDWKDEETLCISDVDKSPESSKINISVANYYLLSANDKDEMNSKVELLQKAKKSYENAMATYQFKGYSLSYNMGSCYQQLGEFSKAVRKYEECLEFDSELEIKAKINLGTVYHDLNQLEMAKKIFKNVLIKEAQVEKVDKVIFLSKYGEVLVKLGDLEDSKNIYHKVLKIDSNRPDDWNNLGVVHYQLKNIVKARDCFKKAFELRPTDKAIEKNYLDFDRYVKGL